MDSELLDLQARICADAAATTEERLQALCVLLDAYRTGQLPNPERGTCELTPLALHALHLLTPLLLPKIEAAAREIAGKSGRWGESLEDEAPAEILMPRGASPSRLSRFRPAEGSFEGWVHTVLWRFVIDRRRKAQRMAERQKKHEDHWRPPPPSRWDANPAGIDPTAVLPDEDDDLKRIREWPVRLRIEILCLAGLWLKIRPQEWERWLQAYQQKRNTVLARPCPPAAFRALDERTDRIQPLGAALGLKRNTLAQIWLRHQQLLDALDFIDGLRV